MGQRQGNICGKLYKYIGHRALARAELLYGSADGCVDPACTLAGSNCSLPLPGVYPFGISFHPNVGNVSIEDSFTVWDPATAANAASMWPEGGAYNMGFSLVDL